MTGLSLMSVFLLGLFGGVHCASMCGGIVALLGSRHRVIPIRAQSGAGALAAVQSSLPLQLAYNAGRIGSYALAGALAGGIGSAAWLARHLLPIQQVAFVAVNLVMIALGIALTGLAGGGLRRLGALERAGAALWRRVGPHATRLLGTASIPGALAAGAAWGWVPCGMVYGVLVAALVSGSAADGALLLLVFGLGTLPNLLALGFAAQRGAQLLASRGARLAAGVAIVLFGLAGLSRIDPLEHLHAAVDACVTWFQ
ncbi:MAG TPA: sulfite exporter TauE/SafE family protein [Burkholderiaceae bacterium]|nr:sulfite exporter TauE/SafE family protein [Burkholderiaceae bacterium]